jgi:hypothetical protein
MLSLINLRSWMQGVSHIIKDWSQFEVDLRAWVRRYLCEYHQYVIIFSVPREGHLQLVPHIFAYLKDYKRSTLVSDETESLYNPERLTKLDWSEFYPGATEAIQPNSAE